MKNLIVLLVLLTIGAVNAQNNERNIGDFKEVKVFDRMRVNLIKSTENKVILKGKDTENIELVNSDGVLKVRMNLDKIFDGNETFVEVYYNNLRVIDANEGAQVEINELLEQSRIEIRVQEGAIVNAGLDVEFAEMRAVTGGIIKAKGSAEKQNVEINTGGIFEGKSLETTDTTLRIQAGGEADIFARRTAQIKIRAGGDVDVYGNPTEVIQDKFIGGRINVVK